MVSPNRRISRPTPPPRVSPATPVCEMTPAGTTSPCSLGGLVQVAEQRPAADGRAPGDRVHGHLVHRAQVDDQATVAGAEPGQAVPAAPDRDDQALGAGVADGGRHVPGGRAPRDQRPGAGRASRSTPRRSSSYSSWSGPMSCPAKPGMASVAPVTGRIPPLALPPPAAPPLGARLLAVPPLAPPPLTARPPAVQPLAARLLAVPPLAAWPLAAPPLGAPPLACTSPGAVSIDLYISLEIPWPPTGGKGGAKGGH